MPNELFSSIKNAPSDPILGLTERFKKDNNPKKVNLGVGVYYDRNGKVPLLESVRVAENSIIKSNLARPYLPIDGQANYCESLRKLIFGKNCENIEFDRVSTFQTLGGTGALRLGADFLRNLPPDRSVWISDPSWENHRGIFERAGFKVDQYPYLDTEKHGINFSAMMSALKQSSKGSIIVLHACCHNPTGVDLTPNQWDQVVDLCVANDLCPFLDMAYQGFNKSLNDDALAIHKFARSGISFLVASSFSKSFALYGERVGGLSVVTGNRKEQIAVTSQMKRIARTTYSNPPTHGSRLVETVLTSKELYDLWLAELTEMRNRIKDMRVELVNEICLLNKEANFNHIAQQTGMFSYTGLTQEQVIEMREKFSIYAVETGRICIAALNSKNIKNVAKSIAEVI